VARLRGFVHIAVAVLLVAMLASYFAVAAVSGEVKAGVASASIGTGGLAAIAVAERRARRRRSIVYDDVIMVVDDEGLDDRDRAILSLLEREGPMGVSEVARRLGISKSTASRKLRKLADRGLIEKTVMDGRPLYAARKPVAASRH